MTCVAYDIKPSETLYYLKIGIICHRVTESELQTLQGTQYTGGRNFCVPDFNKLPYSQGDKKVTNRGWNGVSEIEKARILSHKILMIPKKLKFGLKRLGHNVQTG